MLKTRNLCVLMALAIIIALGFTACEELNGDQDPEGTNVLPSAIGMLTITGLEDYIGDYLIPHIQTEETPDIFSYLILTESGRIYFIQITDETVIMPVYYFIGENPIEGEIFAYDGSSVIKDGGYIDIVEVPSISMEDTERPDYIRMTVNEGAGTFDKGFVSIKFQAD